MSTPTLYLFVGYPGAGKTTVARYIAARTGAVHIWSDNERQKMFTHPTHSAAESRKLYTYLNKKTDELLAAGKSVIFDTNFNFKRDRQLMRELATKHGAQTVLIWMTTPIDIARKRAIESSHGQDTRIWGNMPAGEFDRISSHLQPPTPDEHPMTFDGSDLEIDTVKHKLGL